MSLKVSEVFYSIQGEGACAGKASLFLRLKGCNLFCESPGWRCDTIEVWQKGQDIQNDELLDSWNQRGFLHALNEGAHLVITGGEPLLQRRALDCFIKQLDARLKNACFIEVESNATLNASNYLKQRINQWNLSPKLANAGMSFKRRVQAAVIRDFVSCQSAFFKFVIVAESDLIDIKESFVNPFSIPCERVILMPAAATQQELYERLEHCQRWALREGYRFSSRLQLQIWNESTGV